MVITQRSRNYERQPFACESQSYNRTVRGWGSLRDSARICTRGSVVQARCMSSHGSIAAGTTTLNLTWLDDAINPLHRAGIARAGEE
jgi:hypothetical protein